MATKNTFASAKRGRRFTLPLRWWLMATAIIFDLEVITFKAIFQV